jgi:predicted ATP-grasp superfamily ATP-dependent carboligase
MPKRKKRCIVTYASSWSSLAAARSLGAEGVEVIISDSNMMAPGCFSKYSKHCFVYKNPDTHQQEYLEKLVKEAKKYGGDDVDLAIMPMHTDCFIVAAHQELFDGIAKLALPTFEQIKLAGNKALLAKFCKKHHILIPETWQPDTLAEFEAKIDDFNFPAFIKLQESNASLGLKKVKNAKEAREFFKFSIKDSKLKEGEYPIIQEAVDGEDFCSTFLFNHGEKKASMTYHNILDYPRKNGMGVLRENADASQMEEIGANLLHLLNWHGVAEVDFRWDGKNTPYLIEINPRFWGGLGQSIAAGWNYPYMLYQLAVDGDIPPVNPKANDIKTFNPFLAFLLMVQEFHEAKHPIDEIEAAFHTLKKNFKKHHIHSIEKFIKQLGKAINPVDRFKAVEEVIHQKHGSVNEMFNWKDPLPVLGLLYPIAVFLKHGRINSKMLVSESKIEKVELKENK